MLQNKHLILLAEHDSLGSPISVKASAFGVSIPGGGTPILGHIRDVRPEWVSFLGRKSADGCKFLTKNLRMGHNFDKILPGNGCFSSKLNKTCCSLVDFYCKWSENESVFVY